MKGKDMANTDLPEEFQFESGLPDHLHVNTVDAIFAYDEESSQPDRLNLDITCRDVDTGDEHTFRYPINKFITTDDGATAEHEENPDKRYNQQSAPALLVTSMLENGGQEVLVGRLNAGLTPRHAQFYVNLDMMLDRESYESEINGEKVTWDRMLCAEFYGEVGGAGGAKKTGGATKKSAAKKAAGTTKAAAKKKAPQPVDEVPEETEEAGDEIDAETMAQMDAIADECETHDEFMERVINEVEGAGESDAILTAISEDENVEGSVWARAFERAG